jgi:hypothetical protein
MRVQCVFGVIPKDSGYGLWQPKSESKALVSAESAGSEELVVQPAWPRSLPVDMLKHLKRNKSVYPPSLQLAGVPFERKKKHLLPRPFDIRS